MMALRSGSKGVKDKNIRPLSGIPLFAHAAKAALVGGMGTFYGPVVGALIVIAMQNYLAQFGEWVTVIQGVVFVACVLAFRRGIVGELAARAKISL